jgi:CubicO group peptidase (beta-lactamase class C family)
MQQMPACISGTYFWVDPKEELAVVMMAESGQDGPR